MRWLPQFYLFYLRFDGIFGDNPGEISLGSIITNALLRVYLYNGSQMAWWVYEIITDWNENTATWNNFSPRGGVHVATQTTSTPVTSYTRRSTGWFNIDVTASLQHWATGADNFGWAIINEQMGISDIGDWAGIYSFNNFHSRPTLTVKFATPGRHPRVRHHAASGLSPGHGHLVPPPQGKLRQKRFRLFWSPLVPPLSALLFTFFEAS